MNSRIKINDFSKESKEPLIKINLEELMKLELVDTEPVIKEPPQFWKDRYDFSLDGHSAVGIPIPKNEEEKEELVHKFIKGLEKELTREGNWTFLQQVLLSLDYCAHCEACEQGTVLQLKVGSSTGMNPEGFKKIVQVMEEEIKEKTGINIKIPVDKEGADILLIHNAGEYISWLENPEAYAIIFEKAGISWTLSSEPVGYDAVNYGVWYDDVQLARIALKHVQIAHKLGVKKIVVGECGHATKALVVTAERLLTKENYIPRESVLPMLSDIVENGKLDLDPEKNRFPVTLHDPCNMVRLSGIVEPQRKVLKKIAPLFREMEPHGVCNYCCGGGSGFAIMHPYNFDQWKNKVAARMKVKQITEAFREENTMRPC